MQGEKAESNEKLYFQHFARRKRRCQNRRNHGVTVVNSLDLLHLHANKGHPAAPTAGGLPNLTP